jgi:hypothetical protein
MRVSSPTDQGEAALLEVEIDAVQRVARLVLGLGVRHALQHGGKLALLQRVGLLVAELGQGRELVLAHAHDPEGGPAG